MSCQQRHGSTWHFEICSRKQGETSADDIKEAENKLQLATNGRVSLNKQVIVAKQALSQARSLVPSIN